MNVFRGLRVRPNKLKIKKMEHSVKVCSINFFVSVRTLTVLDDDGTSHLNLTFWLEYVNLYIKNECRSIGGEVLAKRNVKDPEERKQELINIASRLFERDGYEKVSVRDILAEVNGAPGMFYYYFKSKEDIFLACMETYFEEKLKNKLDILQNKEIDYEERIKILRELIVKDIGQFTTRYNFSKENSITDNSYRLWELIHYIGKFIDVYSEFIIEGIENKKIENNIGINRENVISFAAFILYGAVGTIYNDYIIKGENKTNSSEAFGIISELFQRPQ